MKRFHITYFMPQAFGDNTQRTLTGVTIEADTITTALHKAIHEMDIDKNLIKYIIEL
jgi:hypothetical protein